MPIRHRKDRSRLIARREIRARGRRHYLFAYLWLDREAMRQNTGEDHKSAMALCTPNYYSHRFDNIDTWEGCHHEAPPLLAEVHFVQGEWSEEIVAHELCHALLHRLRAVGPPLEGLLMQEPMAAEEAICHEFSDWFHLAYSWLWEIDPPRRSAAAASG